MTHSIDLNCSNLELPPHLLAVCFTPGHELREVVARATASIDEIGSLTVLARSKTDLHGIRRGVTTAINRGADNCRIVMPGDIPSTISRRTTFVAGFATQWAMGLRKEPGPRIVLGAPMLAEVSEQRGWTPVDRLQIGNQDFSFDQAQMFGALVNVPESTSAM